MNSDELLAAERFGILRTSNATVVFVVNTDRFFVTHRLSWAVSFRASGARVVVVSRDTGEAHKIRAAGIEFIERDLGREKLGAWGALTSAIALRRILSKLAPDVVFLVATAAYTLGALSALTLPRSRFVIAVTGRGRALQQGASVIAASAVKTVMRFYARSSNTHILFQLEDDRASFVEFGMASPARSSVVIGTGIDVTAWRCARSTHSGIRVLFAARLFREKGVEDFVKCAMLLNDPDRAFWIAGESDTGVRTAITQAQLEEWSALPQVEILGRRTDMAKLFAEVDILVAPSSHPEGTPRVIMEAMAAGLPVVAYEQPGVKAVIGEDGAGLMVPIGDVEALAGKVLALCEDSALRKEVGERATLRAEHAFAMERTLDAIYGLADGTP